MRSVWKRIIGVLLIFLHNYLTAQSVYEPFDYPIEQDIDGLGGVENGWGGPWKKVQGDSVYLLEGSLQSDAIPISGNRAFLNFNTYGIRYDRPLIERFSDNGFPIWISFLMDFSNEEPRTNVGQVVLMDGDEQLFAVGRGFGNNKLSFFWWPNISGYITDIDATGLHWVVVRINYSGDTEDEQAFLWIDPDPSREPTSSEALLQVPIGNRPKLDLSDGFNAIRIKAEGDPPLQMLLDELRIGKEYSAVSPNAQDLMDEDLIAVESFDYEPGTLEGKGEEADGWVGPWSRVAGNSSDVSIIDGSIIYQDENLESSGNQVMFDLKEGQLRFDRSLIRVIEDDGQEAWVSFLVDFEEDETRGNVGQLVLMNGSQQELAIGRGFTFSDKNYISLFSRASNFQYDSDVDGTGLTWLVTKIKFSGDSDPEQMYMWINPDPLVLPVDSLADVITSTDGTSPGFSMNTGFDGIRIKAEGAPTLQLFADEIKIGRGYENVAPYIAPPDTSDTTEPPLSLVDPIAPVMVYPTVADEAVTFELKEGTSGELMIYDLYGKIVWRSIWSESDNNLEWELQGATYTGTYFYQARTKSGIIKGKMIVKR